MSGQFGKVCSAVSLGVALTFAGTALADSPTLAGSLSATALVGQVRSIGPQAGWSGLRAPPIAARPLAMFGTRGHWSSLSVSRWRLLSLVPRAGNHVLVLSLLGVFGALALHRLNRTL